MEKIYDFNREMIGFAIDDNIAKSLEKDETKAIIEYNIAHYKETMNKK